MVTEDSATQARAGEELDAARIEAYVRDTLPELKGPISVAQFPGGHSNLTYLITVGDTEMVLRRPPPGTKAATAHDMGREYRVLSHLHGVYPYAPKPYAFCEDESVIGAKFYLMQRFHGVILRKDLPKDMTLTPEQARRLCENVLDAQLLLHQVDYVKAGLADFGKPQGYVARQVKGWSERFVKAKTPDVPGCEKLMQWLHDKQPGDSGHVAIIHNDYKFDNVVLDKHDPLKVIGVLDWEMATLGDPLMDLGCSLAYWVEKNDPPPLQLSRMGPTNLPGMPTRQELIERYAQKSGIPIGRMDFYYVFGLFRLGVIAQQIYYRYYHKQVSDQRFAMFGQFVTYLSQVCEGVIAKSDL
ncbi:MAG TPA: phosphotransferase family protein [Nevskiales bacterium]|nr:phosphotransferase family protein [Nevskiales bacterium]